jgi:hypothetical protein
MLNYPFNIKDEEEVVWTFIGDKSVRIIDCDKFPKRKHIKEIIDKVYNTILDEGYIISRTKKDMCGELYLHVICAKLGIAYKSSKDADLEYNKDPRWLVRFFSKILSILF